MKKILFSLTFCTFLLVSCNGGDDLTPYDPNATQNTALLKKTIETFDDNSTLTTTYAYEGFKVKNFIDSDGGSGVFTYSGNNVVKIEYYDGPTLLRSDDFTFNAQNQVTSYKMSVPPESYAERNDYSYNADGTVSVASHFGTLTSQTTAADASKLYFADGELIKKETFSLPNMITETYTYDDKNNPFRNVIGLNVVFRLTGDFAGLNRNLLTASGTQDPHDIQYHYNLAKFPDSSNEASALQGGVETQYTYE